MQGEEAVYSTTAVLIYDRIESGIMMEKAKDALFWIKTRKDRHLILLFPGIGVDSNVE